MSKTRLASLLGSLVLTAMLSACGGAGSSASTVTPPPPPSGNDPPPTADIEGIAMPSSVSVVTATNAS
jgi:hypothetical protein